MLSRGWGSLAEFMFVRSILFFDLLHQVLRVLSTGPRSQGLRTLIAEQWGGDPKEPKFPPGCREIEALSVNDRHRLMGLAAVVIEGWPWRYVGACSECNVWYSWAMKDMDGKEQRYAYTEPVERYLKNPCVGTSQPSQKPDIVVPTDR